MLVSVIYVRGKWPIGPQYVYQSHKWFHTVSQVRFV